MGIGLFVTIILLSAVLGLLAKQALATTEESLQQTESTNETPPHLHVM